MTMWMLPNCSWSLPPLVSVSMPLSVILRSETLCWSRCGQTTSTSPPVLDLRFPPVYSPPSAQGFPFRNGYLIHGKNLYMAPARFIQVY